MRNARLFGYGIAALIAVAGMGLSGCSGSGGGATFIYQPPASQTAEKYVVTGSLADPTGAPLAGTVTLTATDTDGAAVRLYSDKTGGTQLTTATVGPEGVVSFFVDGAAHLPVTVKGIGNAAGRVSSSALITVDHIGEYGFTIKLVSTSSTTTAGVVSSSTPQTTTGTGQLSAALITNVTTSDASKSDGKVTIPAGSILKDSSGTPLSGTVTATVTTFAPPVTRFTDGTIALPSSLGNFPGGLNNVVIAPAGNTAGVTGSFATAGFVAVEAKDSNGNKAATSSTPFTIRLDIPAGTINPETGLPVAVGDRIPIWTYNETSATWKAEIDSSGNQVIGTVQSDAAGLFVQYTTNHFSYWNLDWHYGAVCDAKLNLTNDAKNLPLQLKATFTSGAGFLYEAGKPSGDGTVTVLNVPKAKNLDIYLLDSSNTVIATKKNFDWCAQPAQTVTLDYVAPAAKKPVAVTVSVSEYCAEDLTLTRSVPSAPVYARNLVSNFQSPGVTGAAGTFVYNLEPGITYNFMAYNRSTSTYVNRSLTINGAQTVSFQNPVKCKVISGSIGGVSF
jgi:hypothetical protein